MSRSKEIIEKAYKQNRGVIIILFPNDYKNLKSFAVHLDYTNSSFMLRSKESKHHRFGEEKLEVFGPTRDLKIRLKNDPRIQVPVHGLFSISNNLNKASYAFVVPILTKCDYDVDKLFRRFKIKPL